MEKVKPIFLFSLPRSGSTLLQRLLMSHTEVVSTAEPWLLLPLVYSFRQEGTLSVYSHSHSYIALEDFIGNLSEQNAKLHESLQTFSLSLYSDYCKNGEKYFLDKTPRYYQIIDEISQIFPDAKFIFLFRNPIQIFTSIILALGERGLGNSYVSYYDLHEGPGLLVKGYKKLKDRSYAVQYEQLISAPEFYLKEMMEYLELDYTQEMLKDFSAQNIEGRMGDKSGVKDYSSISTEPLEKWKDVINNPVRKWYVKKYIKQIDTQVLSDQGYDKFALIKEIDGLKTGRYFDSIRDLIELLYAFFVRKFKVTIFFGANTKWSRDVHIS